MGVQPVEDDRRSAPREASVDMIQCGDLFEVLPTLDAESIDACVTDPPYGIGFMGRKWDTFKPGVAETRIVVNRAIESDNPNLKGRIRGPASSPSAVEYDRSLNGQHEFACWCEQWAREVLRVLKPGGYLLICGAPRSFHRMTCGIEDAGFEIRDCLSWLYGQGFPKSLNLPGGLGTALKPSWEPIILARKPCVGSVAVNVQRHGTGALNIDACRIEAEPWHREPGTKPWTGSTYAQDEWTKANMGLGKNRDGSDLGRWPANVLLDEAVAAELDAVAPFTGAAGAKDDRGRHHGIHDWRDSVRDDVWGDPRDERAGASRFYYVAKPSREERDYGASRNSHPTVKPVELMRWLVKLVTPPDGTVLDPFMGSGTTGMACRYEHRQFVGIEREAEYFAIAEARISAVAPLFG